MCQWKWTYVIVNVNTRRIKEDGRDGAGRDGTVRDGRDGLPARAMPNRRGCPRAVSRPLCCQLRRGHWPRTQRRSWRLRSLVIIIIIIIMDNWTLPPPGADPTDFRITGCTILRLGQRLFCERTNAFGKHVLGSRSRTGSSANVPDFSNEWSRFFIQGLRPLLCF